MPLEIAIYFRVGIKTKAPLCEQSRVDSPLGGVSLDNPEHLESGHYCSGVSSGFRFVLYEREISTEAETHGVACRAEAVPPAGQG